MATSISTLGQTIGIINRNKTIQNQMSQFQNQIATGVKYQTFKEYGADSLRIQRYRSDLNDITGFLYNINIAQTNIKQMDSALSETEEQAGNVLSAINIQLTKGSDFNLESIKGAASAALQIVQANMNVKIGDRYLFAGSDVSNQPYTGAATATSNMQTQVTNWLAGTTTADQFTTNVESMTDSQLGYSTTLGSAKNVYARADTDLEVDYTVKASDQGYKDVVAGLNVLANLKIPTEGTDAATKDDFYKILDNVYKFIQGGVEGLRDSSAKVASAAGTLNTMATNHTNDQQNLQKVMESTEATDVTEAAVKFQALQNQMESSYRVTAIISQLNLARFLGSS